MQVKKQHLELDMEQWTGSKLGKEYIKAVYYHPAYLTCMQVKKKLGMEQQTSSKLGKEYIKALYCHSAYLTSMQSSCKIAGRMNHKLE